MNNSPDPIDVEVGARIRLRRKLMSLSQGALADWLDVSFQQVQKYERGANRVSASVLVKIAAKLDTSVGALVGEHDDVKHPSEVLKSLGTFGALKLLAAYEALPASGRNSLVAFVSEMAAAVQAGARR